ncbi:MAG: CapA family protein [Firmicutes bacterium]|nr:CapA family protein [Bacillota bacterium]
MAALDMSFVATGDSFITCRLPSPKGDGFHGVHAIIRQADVRFTNLEVTVHDFEGPPFAFSGGTWSIAPPAVLQDIAAYGFNLLNIANNHTLDYSYGGLEATERYLKEYDFVYAGAGANMARASEPRYLSTPAGRVALIAATSTYYEAWIAGEQRNDIAGRPGVNPLRHSALHMITAKQMKHLREIARDTDINAMNNLNYREGFAVPPPAHQFQFGKHLFAVGDNVGKVTKPHPKDMQRIIAAISQARRQAAEVLVSIHSHEFKGEDKSQPADFLVEFARECIDAGASAVLGHGPHILRAVEIYRGRPIFYSLGNFIFQTDLVSHLPADFYDKYDLGPLANTADAFDARSKNNSIGLGVNPHVWESVLASWKMKDGKLAELYFHPISLGFGLPRHRRGWPELSNDTGVLQRLAQLSEPFGTEIKIEANVGKVAL